VPAAPWAGELKKSTEIHKVRTVTFTKQIRNSRALNRKGWPKRASVSTIPCGFVVGCEVEEARAMIAPIQKNFLKSETFSLTRKRTHLQSGHKVVESSGLWLGMSGSG
jgi:hypothetical protein